MKKILLITALAIATSQVQAGWRDWFSSDDKEEEEKVEAPAETSAKTTSSTAAATSMAMALLPTLTNNLGVTEPQASGGVGSLLQAAQGTLSEDEFSTLSGYIPDTNTLLLAAPAIAGNSDIMGGLLSAAGEYNDTAKMLSQVTSQFEALGLDPAMIGKYVVQIQGYLDSTGGQAAVDLFTKGVSSLI